MSDIVAVSSVRFQTMEQVADLTMQGMNPTEISKQTGIQRKEVLELQADYRAALSQDSQARDMARDHLNMMVKHYDKLIKQFYVLLEDMEELKWTHFVAGQRNNALKAIADLEAKRLDALQKAGLLESGDLGDELAEMEEKQEILIGILRNDLCPDCKARVAYKLAQVSGQAETISAEVVEE
jgi:hypothetical protein